MPGAVSSSSKCVFAVGVVNDEGPPKDNTTCMTWGGVGGGGKDK